MKRSAVIVVALLPRLLLAQGSLTPPAGPIAATMKTLDQVEPCIPIDAIHTPGASGAAFVIATAGSYYFTGNITVPSGKTGIRVSANNVTIDMRGFTLSSAGGGSLDVAIDAATAQQVRLQNGTITNWPFVGVRMGSRSSAEGLRLIGNGGTALECALACQVKNCIATGSSDRGFRMGGEAIVTDCIARNNSIGFDAGSSATLTRCTASANAIVGVLLATKSTLANSIVSSNDRDGVSAGDYAVIENCNVSDNGTSGSGVGINATGVNNLPSLGVTVRACTVSRNAGGGIVAGADGRVSDCIANENTGDGISGSTRSAIIHCTANLNFPGGGIVVSDRAVVSDCSAERNYNDGIAVHSDCLALNNHVSENGSTTPTQNPAAAGIRVLSGGGGNRIDGNLSRSNQGTEILASASDVIVRNFVSGAGTFISPASGANVAPIQSASAATHPLANISF